MCKHNHNELLRSTENKVGENLKSAGSGHNEQVHPRMRKYNEDLLKNTSD